MFNKLKIFILKLGTYFLRFIYFFIKLLPTKNKITFISRESNTPPCDFLLLSDALKKRYPEYQIKILCKKSNKIGYIFHVFKQMYHIATSKIVLLDTYCLPISVLKHKKSLTTIQMWHALGSMKKFGYAMLGKPEGRNPEVAKILNMHKNYNYLFISSNSFIKDYLEGFKCSKDQIIVMPLPRVDILLDIKKNGPQKEIYQRIPKLKLKKNILYCPTFRKDEQKSNEFIEKLINCINFDKYNFLYRPHSLTKKKLEDKRVVSDFKNTYEALAVADYVISDYSSIIYEVGLLDKPIYLYAYDWNEYQNKREFNLDITKIPTLFSANPEEIINAIEKNEFNHKAYQEFTKKNITIPQNISCTCNIVNFINKILNK